MVSGHRKTKRKKRQRFQPDLPKSPVQDKGYYNVYGSLGQRQSKQGLHKATQGFAWEPGSLVYPYHVSSPDNKVRDKGEAGFTPPLGKRGVPSPRPSGRVPVKMPYNASTAKQLQMEGSFLPP